MQPAFQRRPIRAGNTEVVPFRLYDPDNAGQPLDLTLVDLRFSAEWPGGGFYWRAGIDAAFVKLDQTDPDQKGWAVATLSPELTREMQAASNSIMAELETRIVGVEESLVDVELSFTMGSNRDG